MMPELTRVVLAWAAVHLFVALFNCAFYLRLRTGREYLGFAATSCAMAAYCVGAALLVGAPDEAAAAAAQRLQLLAASVGVGSFVSLVYLMLGRPEARPVRIAWAWSALGVGAVLAGLFVDPAYPAHPGGHATSFGPQMHLAAWTPFTVVYAAGTFWIITRPIYECLRNPGSKPDVRLLALSVAPAAIAWAHDSVVHLLSLYDISLLEHFSVLASIGVSYVLLRRYVRTGDELTRRTIELRRSYDELHEVQEELIRKEQLAAVGELSAVIAHEVQHPLGALKRAVGGLGDDELPDARREHLLEILDEETDRLNRLVRDLLVYARPVEPQYEALDLERIWHRAVDMARREHPKSDAVDVDVDLAVPGTVYGDPDLIERAFSNLAENAFEAMPYGGVLTVRVRDAELEGVPAVELCVDDTGEGMDTMVRERARDPFFTTRPSGTGLGLAIVDRVVRAHGGRVQLEANETGGTSVKVELPRDRRASRPP